MSGHIVFVLFLATQVFDGFLTYQGITRYGALAEANPILAWYVLVFGAGSAIVVAKSIAAACGVTLYLHAMHRTVGVLTLLYVTAAVLPWILVLWPGVLSL